MRALLLLCAPSLLWVSSARAIEAPTWAPDPDARVLAENTLVFDRWQGARHDPVERIGVRQRLALWWFVRRPARPHALAVDFALDLNIEADLSPRAGEQTRLPTGRRPALDPRRAALRVQRLFTAVDLELGRHGVLDALGFDLFDGLTVGLRAPHLAVGASVGLGVAPGWNEFGPDIFAPDGTVYDDAAAWAFAVRAEARGLRWLDAGVAVKQRRGRGDLQTSEAGYAGRLKLGPFALSGRGQADLIYARLSDVGASAEYRDRWGAAVGWRRRWPTFRADSIWNAFSTEPHHAAYGQLDGTWGAWRGRVDGEGRIYDAGPTASPRARTLVDGPIVAPDDERSYEGGARVAWHYGTLRPGHVGVEGRVAEGYGGARRYGDVFARTPLPHWRPMDLRSRLGVVSVADRRGGDPVLSGWALVALDWRVAPTIRLEATTEGYVGERTPFRMRAMTHVRFEDWW